MTELHHQSSTELCAIQYYHIPDAEAANFTINCARDRGRAIPTDRSIGQEHVEHHEDHIVKMGCA
jgi:hypothetical protein